MLMVASIPLTCYKLKVVNKRIAIRWPLSKPALEYGLQQINPCNPNANLFSCIKSRFNLDFVDALACFRSSDGRSQTKN